MLLVLVLLPLVQVVAACELVLSMGFLEMEKIEHF